MTSRWDFFGEIVHVLLADLQYARALHGAELQIRFVFGQKPLRPVQYPYDVEVSRRCVPAKARRIRILHEKGACVEQIFAAVKAAVTTREAAVFYGLRVPANGMVCCPFHPDRHPSMKVDARYYCFGCHETGDVIDFVGRLFHMSPLDAAGRLLLTSASIPVHPLPRLSRGHRMAQTVNGRRRRRAWPS